MTRWPLSATQSLEWQISLLHFLFIHCHSKFQIQTIFPSLQQESYHNFAYFRAHVYSTVATSCSERLGQIPTWIFAVHDIALDCTSLSYFYPLSFFSFWWCICFPLQDVCCTKPKQANTKASHIHRRCLYFLCVGMTVKGDRRFHNTEEDGVPQDREDGSCWDFSFFLRGGPIYQGRGERSSMYHGQTLAQCSVCRAAGDSYEISSLADLQETSQRMKRGGSHD